MSGFEIAGVVLGTLPIIVASLQAYTEGFNALQKWRLYKREVKSLVRNLETEKLKMQNVFEKLLIGVAHPSEVERMIDDPLGNLWLDEQIQAKVRLRLWRSHTAFQDTIQDINEAMDDLMEKLGMDPESKVEWNEGKPIARGIKRASLTFKRSTYDDLMTRIKDGVTTLEMLTTSNIELEPGRRQRSQGRLSRIIREFSKGVYEALRCTMTCQGAHNVSLQLRPLTTEVIPQDDDDDILRSLSLLCAVSSHLDQDVRARFWEEVRLRLAEPQIASVPICKPKAPKKSVMFGRTTTAETRSTGTMSITLQASMATLSMGIPFDTRSSAAKPQDIHDLCKVVSKAQKQKVTDCYGNIADSSCLKRRKYSIYPLEAVGDSCTDNWSLVPLTNVLQDRCGAFPSLTYMDKLRLAWIISSSVVQLHNTPWMSTTITHSEIYFIQRLNRPLYEHVFVLKQLPEPALQTSTAPALPTAQNLTLLALGILLVELILVETMDTLRAPGVEASPLTDYETAMGLLGRVGMEGSTNYGSAVRRCLRCEFHRQHRSLEDEAFRQDVFGGIVALLEEDMNNSMA